LLTLSEGRATPRTKKFIGEFRERFARSLHISDDEMPAPLEKSQGAASLAPSCDKFSGSAGLRRS